MKKAKAKSAKTSKTAKRSKTAKTSKTSRAKSAKQEKKSKNHVDSIVERARENLRANGLSVDGPTLKQHVAILEGAGAIGKVDWGKPEKPAEPGRTTAAGMIMPGGPAMPGTTPGIADAQSSDLAPGAPQREIPAPPRGQDEKAAPNPPPPEVPLKPAPNVDAGGRATK